VSSQAQLLSEKTVIYRNVAHRHSKDSTQYFRYIQYTYVYKLSNTDIDLATQRKVIKLEYWQLTCQFPTRPSPNLL